MTSKTTLNAKNLEALGTERLAALLIEISTGSAASKRRLRIELAGTQSSEEVIREITKRLAAIDRSRSKIGWRQVKTLKKDLETQWKVITDTIAPSNPAEALEVMWRFMDLASSVLARTADTNGTLLTVFRLACTDLGTIAIKTNPDQAALADRAFSALHNNEYGQYEGLIPALSQALQRQGMDHLKSLFIAELNALKRAAANNSRRVSYADSLEQRRHEAAVRTSLRQIADAQGDVDAFIETYGDDGTSPLVTVEIASRLLAAGRSREALDSLERADRVAGEPLPVEWESIYADTLEKLERKDDAQTLRWRWFERNLTGEHLRAFLKRLPDFDDMEAEEKALSYVIAYPDAHQALRFLLTWPDLEKAARFIISREAELNGGDHELLSLAADTLRDSFPMASTIALRTMIDFTLGWNRAARYRHAARQLTELETISAEIADFGSALSHDAYTAKLRIQHRTKIRFWKLRRF
ncbi:DUF6880 family protein [Phyllobacterium myrsinacearum]|uniref:Uncharacterized protein n=1 Tax=Phyllobacterium myrsinacearum TaxID=28101 RepID=A0A839EED2_9HYPH|nr:DUF6880 family protein [Phyllobacterium myrsinacearum]MBA8878301.1 hypothetical protein [Phyllobacterium myrsinacearum]